MKESVEIYERFIELDQIGRGSYASVHKAIDKLTGKICAIKKISSTTSNLNNLITEIGIMSNCKCENIIRYLASGGSDQEFLIVMEYCCGGSVKDVMNQLGRSMTVDQISVIVRDALRGLEYLHAKNKIHRDVKAANILLNEYGIAKLGDFGVSEPLDSSIRRTTIDGTPRWLPPEVLNKANYGTSIDIWSLGITIIEMGDGRPPYSELEQGAAMDEIANLEKPAPSFKDPTNWPQNLLEFVRMCLNKDATGRKTARQLLQCEIMQKAPSNEVIIQLVTESCTTIVNQTDQSLYRRYKSRLVEHLQLFNIYDGRRFKVIKGHQMIQSESDLQDEFLKLVEGCNEKNLKIKDTRKKLELLKGQILELEGERGRLNSCLDERRHRKSEIGDQLNKIKEKHAEELRRRDKLRALAG